MAFTDDHIRAEVETGQYTDPAAEKLLSDVLITRRDKIARVCLAKVNPLVKFGLDGSGVLTFENPAVPSHLADAQGRLPGGVVTVRRQHRGNPGDRLAHQRPRRARAGALRPSAKQRRLRQSLNQRRRWPAPVVGDAG